MREYVKPVLTESDIVLEGVYAASGDVIDDSSNTTNGKCRYGRSQANPGSDKCQSCCKSGGTASKVANTYESDFTSCIDGMPMK